MLWILAGIIHRGGKAGDDFVGDATAHEGCESSVTGELRFVESRLPLPPEEGRHRNRIAVRYWWT